MIICDKCGKVYQSDVTPLHCRCGNVTGYIQPEIKPSKWLYFIRMLRKPEDKGVGDTVQRIAAKFGGERFKAFSARIGIPCGCTQRQEEWNKLYPY